MTLEQFRPVYLATFAKFLSLPAFKAEAIEVADKLVDLEEAHPGFVEILEAEDLAAWKAARS